MPLTNRIRHRLSDPYIAIAAVVLFAVTAFVTARSCVMAATIDESRTYFEHIQRGFWFILTDFHGQNHTLQSIASYWFTSLFGLSLFSLRLGSIIGMVIYTLACARLARICTREPLLYALTLLALTINPLVLDMAVLARGYSMALGFFVAALAISATQLQKDVGAQEWKATLKSSLLVSCFCSLSVAANLSFAFANISLIAVYGVWASLRLLRAKDSDSQWSKAAVNALTLGVPGAVVYLAVNPGIMRISFETIYFGSRSWRASYHDLLSILFGNPMPALAFLPLARIAHYLLMLLGLLVLAYVAVVIVSGLFESNKSLPKLDQHGRNWLFLVLVFTVTVTIHTLDHRWFSGSPLPLNRTGLFLLPLGILIFAGSIAGLKNSSVAWLKPGFTRLLVCVGRLVFALLVLSFVICLRVSWVFLWKYDSGAPEVVQAVSRYGREHGIQRIGVEWHLSQAMLFHARLQPHVTMPEIHDLHDDTSTAGESLFVLPDRNYTTIKQEHLKIIYEHPLSKVVVAVRQ
jgi:hypothetical protein